MPDFIYLGISIGSIVFLIQQTDFVYEYISLFTRTTKNKKLEEFLKFDYYQNSNGYSSYVEFICSRDWSKSVIMSFSSKLISCFFCLSCFLSTACAIVLCSKFLFVYFLISILTFYMLFKIKNSIFNSK